MIETETFQETLISYKLPIRIPNSVYFAFYVAVLALLSIHLYRTPIYVMDFVQYMGNALLMENNDAMRIQARVYSELHRSVPKDQLEALLGNEPGAPADQNKSRHERAVNPSTFGEFLPLFAIRPLYNQTLYVVSKMGIGLVKAGILISVISYFLIGVLLLWWLHLYVSAPLGVAVALLTMMTPPLADLGRLTTSDALATVVAFVALYLIFERGLLAAGIAILIASIYFRTDFVALAGPVILICWLQRRMQLWQGAVLSILAVGSVLCINHFAGDYGIGMLYFRNFVGTPVAPAEMHIHLSPHAYLSAFRMGITLVFQGFLLPFLLLAVISLRSSRPLPLLGATLGYVLLHFLVLPNWQERWFGVFYLAAVICAVLARRKETLVLG